MKPFLSSMGIVSGTVGESRQEARRARDRSTRALAHTRMTAAIPRTWAADRRSANSAAISSACPSRSGPGAIRNSAR